MKISCSALRLLLCLWVLPAFAGSGGLGSPGFSSGSGGSGASVPAFVATVCPGLPSGGQCVDFVGNRWWDGIASVSSTTAAAFTDTRSATVPYDPGMTVTTSVVAQTTLPIEALAYTSPFETTSTI